MDGLPKTHEQIMDELRTWEPIDLTCYGGKVPFVIMPHLTDSGYLKVTPLPDEWDGGDLDVERRSRGKIP